jgi:hypothetical protein
MFVINIQNMLQAGMIVGGWDKYEGGQIFSVPLGGTILKQPFAIGGIILPIKLYCSLFKSVFQCYFHYSLCCDIPSVLWLVI